MAVVGHAYVVVRAITDSVAKDIEKGFSGSRISGSAEKSGRRIGNSLVRGLTSGMKDVDNSLTRAADSFRKLHPEADGLRRVFVNIMRAGFLLQGALGALAGTIGTVIGGLGAVIGAAGGAAAALVAVGGAAIAAGVGLQVAKFALGGIGSAVKAATKTTGGYSESVEDLREKLQQLRFDQDGAALSVDRAGLTLEKARQNMLRTQDLAPNNLIRRDAELAFREAELAYRRAKDTQADLKDGLKPDRAGGGAGDPFANLTPSQKAFAEYLVSIQGTFKDLREAAAAGFLPLLQSQIERLLESPMLGILEARFFDIGRGAGLAVKNFTDSLVDSDNLKDLNDVLGDIAEVLPTFGTIFGNVFDSLLSILESADPITRRFVSFLESKSGAFANFLDVKDATGELEAFFNRSGDLAAEFGRLFGGLFGGFGKIIEANFGEGSGGSRLITWLADAAQGFANKDIIGMDNYFQGVADNVMAMGDALGGALDTLTRLGSSPEIKQFFDALDSGSFAFDMIVREALKVQVPLGLLIASVTEIIAVFSDAGAGVAFFDTLNYFAGGLSELLRALKPILDVVGPVLAVVSAIALIGAATSKIALVFGSFIASAVAGMGTFIGATGATIASQTLQITVTNGQIVATKALDVASKSLLASNPIGWAVLAIAALVGLATAIAGIQGANMDKATAGMTVAFDEGTSSLEAFKGAVDQIDGIFDTTFMFESVGAFKDQMAELSDAQDNFFKASGGTTVLADAFGAVGRSLANLAVTDLPDAQKSFKKFTGELSLNNEEMLTAIDEMDEFKKALVDQADQLGISVRNLDGTTDSQKLLNLALGEGEYAARVQAAATQAAADAAAALRDKQIDLNQKLQQGILDSSGFGDALSDAFIKIKDKSGEEADVFSIDKLLENMKTSLAAAATYATNLVILQEKGFSDLFIASVEANGAQAAAIAAGLVGATADQVDDINAEFARGTAFSGDLMSALITDIETAVANNTIVPDLGSKLKKDAIAAAQAGGDLDIVRNQLQNALNAKGNLTLKVGIDSNGISRLFTEITNKIPDALKRPSSMLPQTTNSSSSNGRGGTRPGFAYGGFVSGPGGARSDMIPAMLSNGEYVVNAKSTNKYRGLLEKLNREGNGYASGGSVSARAATPAINIVVNAAPGMDEKELAAMVSRRIAYSIKTGTM